jgi:ParB family transcriptional regulator, chromosome partitioning protein
LQIEFHQLELRYEAVRKRSPSKERLLLGSLSESGQQMPAVVVRAAEAERYVLVDGYKRVRALKRLGADSVRATVWELEEPEALLMERLMRCSEPEGALEQGWLLRELRDRFGMNVVELGRRFDRTPSWVSRRLALVSELPETIQKLVSSGAICAHAAMKCLVPLARANADDCIRLGSAVAWAKLSSRQMAELYAAYRSGGEQARERLLSEPLLYLKSLEAARGSKVQDRSPAELLLADLGILSSVARRASRRLTQALWPKLMAAQRKQAIACAEHAREQVKQLFQRWDRETGDATAEHTGSDLTLT